MLEQAVRYKTSNGYIIVQLQPSDQYYPMAMTRRSRSRSGQWRVTGYVLEHRLVMAQHLKRCLEPQERVHHKNGVKDDNRVDNLGLCNSHSAHRQIKHKEIYRDGYQQGWSDTMRLHGISTLVSSEQEH